MKLSHFLSDQKWFVLTFSFVLLFTVILISVDPKLHISLGSLVYLVILSIMVYCGCFLGTYFFKNYQLKKWKQLPSNGYYSDSIPLAVTHEQQIYIDAMKRLSEQYLMNNHMRDEENKEQLEFMTQWFHEIKTPIAVSRLLLETEVDSPSLLDEINKIEAFVEQALYFSRLHEFNKDYMIEEINLEKCLKEMIKAESKTFISKRIKVSFKTSQLTVISDQKGLIFIIRQLLLNSLKYSDNHSEISFSINQENRTLTIRDHGIGIPPEDLPRVFEKGFTGKNGRAYQRSTGMGLYLAKKTADKLGHELSIFSTVCSGTEAILYFPERYNLYTGQKTSSE
ncbi:sensor histidine kinase [Bacillus sp. 1P10SD]|uniref:ATP-binding protein n=1 Tax=Bacillus sp. 1P10SD TaxID=3132265 RepID=UPI0039A63B92